MKYEYAGISDLELIHENKMKGMREERDKLKVNLAEAIKVIQWYAEWDWTDKYVQAIPKRALAFLAKLKDSE